MIYTSPLSCCQIMQTHCIIQSSVHALAFTARPELPLYAYMLWSRVLVVVVLLNLVVERPNSTTEQDNSKPQNNNRWIQNGWDGGGLFGSLDKIPGSQLVHNADANGLLAFGRLGGGSSSASRVF